MIKKGALPGDAQAPLLARLNNTCKVVSLRGWIVQELLGDLHIQLRYKEADYNCCSVKGKHWEQHQMAQNIQPKLRCQKKDALSCNACILVLSSNFSFFWMTDRLHGIHAGTDSCRNRFQSKNAWMSCSVPDWRLNIAPLAALQFCIDFLIVSSVLKSDLETIVETHDIVGNIGFWHLPCSPIRLPT